MTAKKNIAVILRTINTKSETFLTNIISIVSQEHDLWIYYERGPKEDILYLQSIKGVKKVIRLAVVGSCLSIFKQPLKALKYWSKLDIPRKRKFIDFNYLLNSKIDYYYYPFGYNTTWRETYGLITGAKTAVSFMGSDLFIWPKTHGYDYKNLLENSSKIHCNSSQLKQTALLIHSSIEDKIQVIPSGLRKEFEEINFDAIINSRQKKGLTEGEIIITIGRLNWIKGYETTLFSLSNLKVKGLKFKYHIIGYGPEEEKLKTLVSKLNLVENVIFEGFRNTEEIIDLLGQATLYVQTSWSEGFSNSVLEAQSMGLYSIVTPVSGMDDIIVSPNNGKVLSSFSIDELTQELKKCFSKESYNARMVESTSIREGIIRRFGTHSFSKNWLNFFEEIS